jgi:hypothetical protein
VSAFVAAVEAQRDPQRAAAHLASLAAFLGPLRRGNTSAMLCQAGGVSHGAAAAMSGRGCVGGGAAASAALVGSGTALSREEMALLGEDDQSLPTAEDDEEAYLRLRRQHMAAVQTAEQAEVAELDAARDAERAAWEAPMR